uniref:Uncharacterized protein n=1 Tax=Kalanchoe fedtschenkoi TaxID=63787 RepID=A0A7N0VIZ7_KALFE
MAALSVGICCCNVHYSSQISGRHHLKRPVHKTHFSLSCRISEPEDGQTDVGTKRSKKELKLLPAPVLTELEKLGKELGDFVSPKQKGDWKDVVLMSLSFAVLVYISQRIVCAYCAWKSLIHSSW